MAFNKTSSTERYIGLSTDTKPSAPIGSEFWEYDTGIVYACYDGTNWAVKVDYTVPSVTANQGTVGASPWLVTPSATELHLGEVGGNAIEVDLTCTLDTNIYADGDVLFDTVALANAVRVAAGYSWLKEIIVNDEDDQGVAFDLIFLNAANSLGTINLAPNISDANARAFIGRVSVGAGDYYDLGGVKVAHPEINAKLMKAAVAQTSIWVAGISRGAGTYSANGLRLKFMFARE